MGRWEAPASGTALPSSRILAGTNMQLKAKNNNNINFLKAFILFFFLSPLFQALCRKWSPCSVCVPVPAIPTWSHGGCKDPPVATSFLQTAGQEMSCPNNAFLEGNAKAHTHLNTTESKKSAYLQGTCGENKLCCVFWGISGLKTCRDHKCGHMDTLLWAGQKKLQPQR